MLLITKNNLGKIFISKKVISKILLLNLNNNKKNIIVHNVSVDFNLLNYFIELEISSSINNINNFQFQEIKNYLYDQTKKDLISNFNLAPKNISIIYKNA